MKMFLFEFSNDTICYGVVFHARHKGVLLKHKSQLKIKTMKPATNDAFFFWKPWRHSHPTCSFKKLYKKFCCLVVKKFILFSFKSSRIKNQKCHLISAIISHEKVSTLKSNMPCSSDKFLFVIISSKSNKNLVCSL